MLLLDRSELRDGADDAFDRVFRFLLEHLLDGDAACSALFYARVLRAHTDEFFVELRAVAARGGDEACEVRVLGERLLELFRRLLERILLRFERVELRLVALLRLEDLRYLLVRLLHAHVDAVFLAHERLLLLTQFPERLLERLRRSIDIRHLDVEFRLVFDVVLLLELRYAQLYLLQR